MRRALDLDALACPHRGGRLRVVAAIQGAAAACAVTLFQHCGELIRAYPRPPEQLKDAMATGAVKEEIERKGREKQGYQSHAEASRRRRNGIADEVSETDPSPGPRHRAREAVKGKS